MKTVLIHVERIIHERQWTEVAVEVPDDFDDPSALAWAIYAHPHRTGAFEWQDIATLDKSFSPERTRVLGAVQAPTLSFENGELTDLTEIPF